MNILVPVDGSPASLRALDYAIAHYPEASFVLLTVQNVEIASELMYTDWQELLEQAAVKALKEATEKSEAASVRFETFLRMGAIAETIAQVAREKSIDHIVMGARGHIDKIERPQRRSQRSRLRATDHPDAGLTRLDQ
jgi:nucleotide-binding universal stress UspA family protein